MKKKDHTACEKCQAKHCKAHHMKEVGVVVAPVVEAVKETAKRIWIGSGEDFHPAVTN